MYALRCVGSLRQVRPELLRGNNDNNNDDGDDDGDDTDDQAFSKENEEKELSEKGKFTGPARKHIPSCMKKSKRTQVTLSERSESLISTGGSSFGQPQWIRH